MEFNYQLYRDSFVNFFLKKGYKTFVSDKDKDLIFMYNSTSDISIIKISKIKKTDNELENIRKKIAKSKNVNRDTLKVISIILNDEQSDSFDINGNNITINSTDFEYLKLQLGKYFSNIDDLVIDEKFINNNIQSSSKKTTLKEINDLEDIKTPEDLQTKLTQFTSRLKSKPSFGSLFFFVAFLILPIIGVIVTTTMGINGYSVGISRLFQGGTTYSLTILGGQGWRILTYGFSAPSDSFILSIMIIIIAGWSTYNMMKMNEFIMNTWKFVLAFFISYVMLGFFTSVLTPNYVTGGILPILAIVTGMLTLNVSGSKTLVSSFGKMKLVWPFVILIIFPILVNGGMEYVGVVTGFVIGGVMGFMFTYDYKEINWRIGIPIAIILLVILMPSIMIAIPQYVPGQDINVIYTLSMYIKKGMLSVESANKILNNIGWTDVKIEEINGSLIIPYPYL